MSNRSETFGRLIKAERGHDPAPTRPGLTSRRTGEQTKKVELHIADLLLLHRHENVYPCGYLGILVSPRGHPLLTNDCPILAQAH